MAKNETDDTEERLLSSYPLDLESDLQRREAELAAAQRQFRWIRLSSYALFATALCLFSATWVMQHSGNADGSCSELQCAKITSPYSPAWEAVELWEGEFTNFFNHTSKYRGPPTLELEAAWDELWNTPGISIDQAGLDALNKSQPGKQYANSLESTPEKPLYAASLEVTHQLHCLNLIRQATWPLSQFNKTWETYPSVLDDDIAGRLHVDHCVETLRLSLMCYSDVTPLLAELTPDRPGGFQLDFNVHHKCRNFDKVTEFLHEHGSDVRVDEDGQPI